MLKFITIQDRPVMQQISFNTSHVKVYHIHQVQVEFDVAVSIHLMLKFIPLVRKPREDKREVSIHLMLKFISLSMAATNILKFSFNTSHVKVYRHCSLNAVCVMPCFNTSHVKVYQILLSFILIFNQCFNTSHVKVYPILNL